MSRTARRTGRLGDVDLRLLRVFLTVARNGGFAASEVELNKSRSAISVDISALEARLGYRLCSRGRRGFALTREGTVVLEAANELFAGLTHFQERIAAATDDLSGDATLMVNDNIGSVASDSMTRAIRQFRRTYPRVRLVITAAPGMEVERAILQGQADVGISILPHPIPELEVTRLFSEESLLYCGEHHHLFARADEATLEEIAACSFLNSNSLVSQDPDEPFEPSNRMVRSSALDLTILVLLAGADIGFLPTHYARRWVERDELRALQPERLRRRRDFHLIRSRADRNGRVRDALSTVFLDCCRLNER